MDGSLYLRSRDMLKFGILYLNEGIWQDQQLISKNWIDKSISEFGNNRKIKIPIEDSGKNSYGYQWWMSRLKHNGEDILMYRANGWGGQVIMVFPERDMVVVITSGNFASKSRLFKLVNKYILPSLS